MSMISHEIRWWDISVVQVIQVIQKYKKYMGYNSYKNARNTCDTRDTANSSDVSKTSASVSRLSNYFKWKHCLSAQETIICMQWENISFNENMFQLNPNSFVDKRTFYVITPRSPPSEQICFHVLIRIWLMSFEYLVVTIKG